MSITRRIKLQSARLLLLACASLLMSAACTQRNEAPEATSQTETAAAAATTRDDAAFAWARDALARNAQVELVASDPQKQVFTLRNRQSGEVSAVKLSELAAAPATQLAGTTAQLEPAIPTEVEPSTPSQPAAANSQPAATGPSDTNVANVAPTDSESGYTIERDAGQVRVTGPGVSIVSSGSQGAANTDAAQASSDPIICEGQRMLHFDNREFVVQGDAITVRGGCELYLTNSRVIATGTGIVVQDGTVHVSNSHVEGQEGSFDADNRAKVFVRGSTFRGLPRRAELAHVQDQGGNRWR